jgi:hypothetical protein
LTILIWSFVVLSFSRSAFFVLLPDVVVEAGPQNSLSLFVCFPRLLRVKWKNPTSLKLKLDF